MNEKKLTPLLQSKNWKNLFYFTQKEFNLLYAESYVQTDGVAMDSPLGPVLAGTFMVEL